MYIHMTLYILWMLYYCLWYLEWLGMDSDCWKNTFWYDTSCCSNWRMDTFAFVFFLEISFSLTFEVPKM